MYPNQNHRDFRNFTPPQLSASPKSKRKMWLIVAAGLVIVLLLLGWLLFSRSHKTSKAPTAKTASKTAAIATKSSDNSPISLLAAGDFIAHDSINSAAQKSDGSYDYLPLMNDFTSIFHKNDIRFCNDANLNGGSQFGIAGYPKFNSPTEFTNSMGAVGCNVVNTTTNHSYDKNQDAINASVDAWSKVPNTLAVAGENRSAAERDTIHYFTVKGVKVAFLAYTSYFNNDAPAQNDYGANFYSDAFAASQIAAAKQSGAKFIMVSIRWGVEYSGAVDAKQKQIAQYLADQGVNLVLGHGSHVLEPVAQLTGQSGNKTMVWYSLGNFLQTQEPADTVFNGVALMDIDPKTLAISNLRFLPLYMHYEWTAAQAANDTTANLAARHDVRMYRLEDATQAQIDSQQLHTTVAAQKQRLQSTLNADGLSIPLINSNELK